MHKTALVTGAYGFIGRHVARQLAKDGWRVIGMGHGSWTAAEWQAWGIAEWHSVGITLDTLITYAGGPAMIVHCAGSGSVGFSMAHPYQDFQRTVATTLAVLEYARMYAPQTQITYPSSAGVYGKVQELPIVETTLLSPASPYGTHKCLAEDLCKSYARHFNINVAVVRLFSVYGSGLRKQLLWDACQKIKGGNNSYFGTGEEVRDWLYVEDAATLLITAAGHATTKCPIVNGGSGVGTSVRRALTELFACSEYVGAPVFTGVARKGDPPGYVADISLASQWEWKPKMELHEGLCDYVEWFKRGAQ